MDCETVRYTHDTLDREELPHKAGSADIPGSASSAGSQTPAPLPWLPSLSGDVTSSRTRKRRMTRANGEPTDVSAELASLLPSPLPSPLLHSWWLWAPAALGALGVAGPLFA